MIFVVHTLCLLKNSTSSSHLLIQTSREPLYPVLTMAEPTKGDYPHHRASTDLRCDDQSRGPVAACYEPSDVHNELHLKAAASNKDGICTFATALQQLYRGCELLQEVLYAFREVAYPFNVSKVVFEDGKLHVHEAASNPGDGPLYSLPEHLVHDPDHRKALLAYYACCDAPAYLCELLKKVLKGKLSVASSFKNLA